MAIRQSKAGHLHEVENLTGIQTNTALIPAPGAGESIFIHRITVADKSGAANTVNVEDSTPAVLFEWDLAANGDGLIDYIDPLEVGDNLAVQLDATLDVMISIEYELGKAQ